jgi:YD repeat-containing protein
MSNARSRLASLQEIGRDTVTTLPAVTMTWADNDDGTYLAPVTVDLSASTYFAAMADVDGDGRMDLISKNVGNGFASTAYVHVASHTGDGTYSLTSTSSPGGVFLTTSDVNGDGKADLIFADAPTRATMLYIALSNGDGTFGNTIGWTLAEGYFAGLADVNGDGREDLIASNTGDGFATYVWVSLANGSGGFGNPVGTALAGSLQRPVDVNGDGRADLLSTAGPGQGGSQVFVQLSNGDGTFGPSAQTSLGAAGFFYTVGDFNGDGLVDIASTGACGAPVAVWASNGDGTFANVGAATSGGNSGCFVTFADVNGDGRADAVGRSADASSFYVQVSNGDGTFQAPVQQTLVLGGGGTYAPALADVNGDGKIDLIVKPDNGFLATSLQILVRSGTMRDAMTSIVNGYGGTTTIEYAPSSKWVNVNNPPIYRTVTAITTDDANGNRARSTFAYKNGKYNRVEREFLGFGYVKHVRPEVAGETSPPYDETTYLQDFASAGKPSTVEHKAGDGTPLTSTVYQYQTNGTTTPFTCQLVAQTDRTYGGSFVRRVGETFVHDAYGNVTTKVENGDLDLSGDERTTQTNFSPNTAAFITSKPSSTAIYAGTSSAGTKLSEQIFYYDDNGVAGKIGAGLLTRTDSWLDATNSYLTTQKLEYDAFGNVITRTDARGNSTTYQYDTTYNQFAISTKNALNQITTSSWDFGCGSVTRVTDPNGTLVCTQFDALCRPVERALPGDSLTDLGNGFSRDASCPVGGSPTERTEYLDWGTVNQQRTVVHHQDSSATGRYESTFYDGLGRTILSCAKADPASNESGGVETCTATSYDARGNTAAIYVPFFSTVANTSVVAPPAGNAYRQRTFDALGRLTREQLMNGGIGVLPPETFEYGVSQLGASATKVDSRGYSTVTNKDAYGQVVSIQRQGGSATPYGACATGNCPTCTANCAGKCEGAADGCGGLCASTCASGQTCVGDTCCSPTSSGCTGRSCGTASDGCGGVVGCGSCASGLSCTAAGTCIACGAANQPCCAGGTACQSNSLFCNAGTCAACGAPGQTCCPAPSTPCASGVCNAGTCAACGAVGQACCPSPQAACGSGAACSGGSCVGCGNPGQPECPGGVACNPGATPCANASCTPGTCVGCGGPSQPCCATGAACGAGAYCTAADICIACGASQQDCCPSPQQPCSGGVCSAGKCTACGAPGQPECGGSSPCDTGATPCPDATCAPGTCVGCGGASQFCCATGAACGTGFVCSTGKCHACGAPGQPICPGNGCQQWATPCPNATCTPGTCVGCGNPGAYVCASPPACQPGAMPCNNASCQSGTCIGCGAPGQSVCSSGTPCQPGAMPCNSASCTPGTCIGCGSGGQSCCSTAPACQSNFVCSGGQCVCGNAGQPCCSGSLCNSPWSCQNGSCR